MKKSRLIILWALGVICSTGAETVEIELVSARSTNSPAIIGETLGVVLSSDGRWAAITVSDRAVDGPRFSSDVFLRDLTTGEDMLVSRNRDGNRGNGASIGSALSADGRYVLCSSDASDLVEGDDNGLMDVFLLDRLTARTILVSKPVSESSHGDSFPLAMTADGRFVLFESEADNLVPNDGNEDSDIFRFDRETGNIELVTERFDHNGSATGALSAQVLDAAISLDGRYVAFMSSATNLVSYGRNISEDQIFIRDMTQGSTRWVNMQWNGEGGKYGASPVISTNGNYMAFITADLFTGPTPFHPSTFVHVFEQGSPLHVLYDEPDELLGAKVHWVKELAMTPDGRRMVATVDYQRSSLSDGGSTLEVYDNVAHTNGLVQVASTSALVSGSFASPRLSADGNILFFTSNSPELPGGNGGAMQLYRHDFQSGVTRLISTNAAGMPASGDVSDLEISDDGEWLSFMSDAANFQVGPGGEMRTYLQRLDRSEGPIEVAVLDQRTPRLSGNAGSRIFTSFLDSNHPATPLSVDGRFAVFTSEANDLLPTDSNHWADLFIRDLNMRETRMINVEPNGSSIKRSRLVRMSEDGSRVLWSAGMERTSPGFYKGALLVYDSGSRLSKLASVLPDGSSGISLSGYSDLSANGRYVLFSGWLGIVYGIYIRDLDENTTFQLPSVIGSGYRTISRTGKYIFHYADRGMPSLILDWRNQTTNSFDGQAIGSSSDDLTMLFLRYADRSAQTGDLYIYRPMLNSSNLVATNVLVGRLSADASTLVYTQLTKESGGGEQAESRTFIYHVNDGISDPLLLEADGSFAQLTRSPAITPDGRFIAFVAKTGSGADEFSNLYLLDRASSHTTLVSIRTNGAPADTAMSEPSISADGRVLLFDTEFDGFVPNDSNLMSDVFVARVGSGLEIERTETGLSIFWSSGNGAILQQSGSIEGEWTAVTPATDPYEVPNYRGAPAKFFRVIHP